MIHMSDNPARCMLVRTTAALLILVMVFGFSAVVEAGGEPVGAYGPLLEIFDEALPEPARWEAKDPEEVVRDSRGYAGGRWAYMHTRDGKVSITGLSVCVRENPGPGEYRYLSFAWRKWGGGQLSLELNRSEAEDGQRQRGNLYGYRFDVGEGPPVGGQSLRLSEVAPENWAEVTRDLWQDFGDFTITGATFVSVEGRDAAFDRIYVARTMTDLEAMPLSQRQAEAVEGGDETASISSIAPILPAQVAAPVDVDAVDGAIGAMDAADGSGSASVILHSDVEIQTVSIDWWNQIMSGGFTMVPLLALSIGGVVIGVQRLLTIRVGRMAPPNLEPAVRRALADGDVTAAMSACDRHPSTLADTLRFIVEHRHNDVQVVNQAAGDIAARDIRDRLSSVYPLSVIGSLAPLLGLLGTIIGMIEAFALVSIYGDEGGSTILSGSISKALITTAAGLIIAIPAVAAYYVIRNRLMRIASRIEVATESLITSIYLKKADAP